MSYRTSDLTRWDVPHPPLPKMRPKVNRFWWFWRFWRFYGYALLKSKFIVHGE